uniref:Uncharacterized protein n=1 Tax=Romanomermis culicivorax TaxID=13658 RepID=A0A915I610_ROMCU
MIKFFQCVTCDVITRTVRVKFKLSWWSYLVEDMFYGDWENIHVAKIIASDDRIDSKPIDYDGLFALKVEQVCRNFAPVNFAPRGNFAPVSLWRPLASISRWRPSYLGANYTSPYRAVRHDETFVQ